MPRYLIAANQPNHPAHGERERGTPRFEGDEYPRATGSFTKEFDQLRFGEMVQKQICYDRIINLPRWLFEPIKNIRARRFHEPTQSLKSLLRLRKENLLSIHQNGLDRVSVAAKPARYAQQKLAVPSSNLDDASGLSLLHHEA